MLDDGRRPQEIWSDRNTRSTHLILFLAQKGDTATQPRRINVLRLTRYAPPLIPPLKMKVKVNTRSGPPLIGSGMGCKSERQQLSAGNRETRLGEQLVATAVTKTQQTVRAKFYLLETRYIRIWCVNL